MTYKTGAAFSDVKMMPIGDFYSINNFYLGNVKALKLEKIQNAKKNDYSTVCTVPITTKEKEKLCLLKYPSLNDEYQNCRVKKNKNKNLIFLFFFNLKL